jgi:UDP-3-O-[3-hydroxymyristoyl] glucosamine N-acyltransferase
VIGDNVTLAGQVGVAGHVKIGNGVEVGAKSGVVDDVPDGAKVLGLPAIPLAQARKALLLIRFLPEMRKELRDLRLKVAVLEGKPGGPPCPPDSD